MLTNTSHGPITQEVPEIIQQRLRAGAGDLAPSHHSRRAQPKLASGARGGQSDFPLPSDGA